ncbi:ribonuclease H-like domain-containing protein, partial [Tanacetum coccineum]
SKRTVNVEETSSKAMVAVDGAGFDWSYMADDEVPTNMALMAFSDSEEFQQPEFESYGPKSVSEDISNEVRESPYAPLVEELVSDDKLEKKLFFTVTKIEFVRPKQQEKQVRKPGHPQKEDQGYVDSGCSRHMTGNMSYLSDFKEFDGGYMCDKKNSVLFTDTGCFVLSPDFKLADESQVLLKVPRKNNMYSVVMKNIVPKESLSCLVAKATLDESMLWHRKLGHVNFKTINKLVKENIVRGLPLKRFENDQTCVVCLKGKQHKASSFTWVFFLATKDETSGILKSFITEIENLVDKKVKIIRCDNGTEFKNKVMSKFDGKLDEGFFIGYSLNSKAFRVYNIRTRKVEENLHIRFLEDKPIIAGDGPKWLFDIDVLTKSMNYVPVVAGTNSNDLVGTEESIGAGHSSKETGSSQDYILMPLWKDGSLFDFLHTGMVVMIETITFLDGWKEDDDGVNKESGIDDQERPENSTQDVNTLLMLYLKPHILISLVVESDITP